MQKSGVGIKLEMQEKPMVPEFTKQAKEVGIWLGGELDLLNPRSE